ncbi:hypothetical protein WMY93_002720 [Mugilogobius chulae]|uniref:Uncharacterized protein n=1 Tax=Mugilogobius chulae TaxID=88201 RepID=A0AAW0PXG5_9GOBI
MSAKCGAGLKWDSLVKSCMPLNIGLTDEPSTKALVQLKNTPPADQSGSALWIVVLFALLGSILALVLWLIIYRRHWRRYTEEEPAEQPPLQTDHASAPCLPPCETHSPLQQCQHLHTGLPLWQGGGFDWMRTEHEECDWNGLNGSAVRQETVPLPATELVTTKTV